MTESNSETGSAAAPNQTSIPGEIALGEAAAQGRLDPRAAAYLEEQTRLAKLQADDLLREDKLRHWSVRMHHVSGVMKLAFEFSAAFILLATAVFLAGAIWTASQDKSLVIDAFDVPPDLVERGLSGQVIAARVEDRLAWMQAHTITSRPASTYRHDWGDDIKVQIPETGISIGELYRYLVGWLGSQTHITGAIWRTPGGLALATRAGTSAAPTLHGAETELDAILIKAAEQIYRQTQPYRYIAYLDRQGRIVEELAAARDLALNGPPEEKPWAYTRWGVTLESMGDLRGALEKQRMATVVGPTLPHAWYNLASVESALGHDGDALRDNLKALDLLQSPAADQLASYAVAVDIPILKMVTAEAKGDYRLAIAQVPVIESTENYGYSHQSAPIMLAADLASDHDISASIAADHGPVSAETASLQMGGNGNFELQPLPTLERAVALQDWRAARADLLMQDNSKAAQDPAVKILLPILTWPWLAYAQARLGDFKSAQLLIGRTPLDCYLCLRMRGNIDAARKDDADANRWFARAIASAPSLPFAYVDWGQMLLQEGKFNAAIAKFTRANQEAPNFADPLELWGEALMRENRSDLALAKFEEASRYAPRWGHLFLKWGEALRYVGEKADSRTRLKTAATLSLNEGDRAALAKLLASAAS